MTWPVHTVRIDDRDGQAAALLAEKNVTVVPVLDPAGLVVGMVSESDLLRNRVPAEVGRAVPGDGPVEPPALVRELISTAVVTAAPDDDVAEVADRMLGRDVRSLPGVTTATDRGRYLLSCPQWKSVAVAVERDDGHELGNAAAAIDLARAAGRTA